MISIVVCSINTAYLDSFKKSLEKTIGLEYELNVIHNNIAQLGICAAYNQAAKQSKYDYLCFIHEDVLFQTDNWGQILIDIFKKDEKMGLVGIAGTTIKNKMPSSYTQPSLNDINPVRYHLIQSYKKQQKEDTLLSYNPDNELISNVVCIDGVFLATKKAIWSKYNFDEQLIKGFHSYDLDFSLQIQQEYTIAVSHQILITHLSEGSNDENWLINNIKVHKKWKNRLPLNVNYRNNYPFFEADLVALTRAYFILNKSNLSFGQKLTYFSQCLGLFSFPLTFLQKIAVINHFLQRAIQKYSK